MDSIALIASSILSLRGSNSRSICCDIVGGGQKRWGLGKVRHSGGVRHPVVDGVNYSIILLIYEDLKVF